MTETVRVEQKLFVIWFCSKNPSNFSKTWFKDFLLPNYSRLTPTVVFLQELVHETLAILIDKVTDKYEIISPSSSDKDYFTAILVEKTRVKIISQKLAPFQTSQMGRDLLQLDVPT